MTMDQGPYPAQYPVQFAVEYPDRPLNRLTSFFRIFVIIPIAIVLGTVSGATWESAGSTSALHHSTTYYGPAGAGGLLFFGPLLMILFRRKYPWWWFDWNLELQRFINRVWTYLALMNDSYPSTDDHQWVQLDYAYPDAATGLNRWLPLVKWLLAIPHYIVLFFLEIGGPDNLTFNEVAALVKETTGRHAPVRHIPRPALHAMTWTTAGIKPALARQARAALVMDTIDMTFDPAPARRAFPDLPNTGMPAAIKELLA